MNTFKPLRTAQQKRADYQRRLREERADLPAPVVPDIIAGDPDGLIPAHVLANPLKVTVDSWRAGDIPMPEALTLRWAEQGSSEYLTLLEQAVPGDATFPLTLHIPVEAFIEGRRMLGYQVEVWGGDSVVSPEVLLTLDITPPYDRETPLAPVLDTAVVTDAWLDGNNGEVTVTIPAYADQAPGDIAIVYWLKEVPDEWQGIPYVGVVNLDQGREFKISRTVLTDSGDGDWYAMYVLKDKAGNISELSFPTEAAVALGPLPSDLKVPYVPLAEGGIDRDDAFLGVVIEIPAFAGGKNGDLILASWGATALDVYPLGPSPQFPLRVQVPWAVMRDRYDFTTGGPQPLTVSYQVKRGSLLFPEAALTTDVQVNFEVVGPDNPGEPDPVNPGLPLVVVRGESNLDNALIEADQGKPAKASIPLYASAKGGDLIYLYWNGVRIPEFYEVKPGDVVGDPIEMTIAWEHIAGTGNNPALPVHYVITDAAEINYQQSVITPVSVKVETISFPAPTFPHIDEDKEFKVLNCSSIRRHNGELGVFVHIAPDGKYLKAGVQITLDWWVTEWLANGTGTKVDGTEFTDQITLDTTHEVNGVDFFVQPYDKCLLPAYTETANRAGLTTAHFRVMAGGDMVSSETASELIGLLAQCPLP